MAKQINFLKERAREFWDNALKLFSEGKSNISAFNLEQAVQLYLKFLIGKKIGEWPQSHYLSELIQRLTEVYENERIKIFYQENELFFEDLTDIYFTSRYYPRVLSPTLVKKLIDGCQSFFNLIFQELKDNFLE